MQMHAARPFGFREPEIVMAAKLTLISHKLCPYVQRAVIALNEKGVPFERVDIDLANKPGWFLKISPLGKVPVLVVRSEEGEVALFESNVICEYIEETQGGAKLHPQDPLQRAQHRAWMEFGSTILAELWGLETTGDPAVFESKRVAIAAKFARVEDALGSGPFFAGEKFSLVDAVFAPIFRYFDVFDALIDLSIFAETPKVRAWRSALAERPSVRTAVGADYPHLLHAFLVRHNAHMLKLAA
jgi:glutathione S-transferase